MDIFIEEMVKKRKTALSLVLSVVSIFFGSIAIFLLFTIVLPIFYHFSSLIVPLAALIVYGIYLLISSFNAEYEYSLVNSEIDIDKITNKRKRRRLTTAYIQRLEAFGTTKNPDFARYKKNTSVKKIYACRDKNFDDIFFLVYNIGAERVMLFFNPSDRIISEIAKRNPKKQLL